VWTLVFGVVASLGRSATVVAINACVAFVLFSNRRTTSPTRASMR